MKSEYVHEMFSRIAGEFGDAPAIEQADKRVTYRELEQETNRLAGFMLASGYGAKAMIAILAEDAVTVITSMIAVLKAGSIFVPLDPRLPLKRLEAIMKEVEPSLLIVEAGAVCGPDDKFRDLIANYRTLYLGGDPAGGRSGEASSLTARFEEHRDTRRIEVTRPPDDPCYIYFTSGSTGRPKGIIGRLKAIDHFIRWEIKTLGCESGMRASQLTTPSFDAYLRDVFTPLCVGGTVCAPANRDTILDSALLAEWLDVSRINLVHCVPSLFRMLLNRPSDTRSFDSLQYIVMAGESLLPSDVGRWRNAYGERVRLINLYGPTETTMTKFCYPIQPEDQYRRFIPIGKPIEGARALVLDPKLRACAPGIVGEIYIRTPYRTLGYSGQPDLTREVFVPNPFTDDPEDLIYKTGDLGRLHEDGNFEFLGRKDQQVKVRGVRIELDEIESLLRSFEGVGDAVVVAYEDQGNNKSLCAYLVIDQTTDVNRLRESLRQHLPEYMVPSTVVEMEKLPRTISGKVDRKLLPKPAAARSEKQEFTAPRTKLEESVAEIWRRILRIDLIGVHDNFFDLGGHSLLATMLLAEISSTLEIDVPLRALFADPTIAGLAGVIGEIQRGRANDDDVILQNGSRVDSRPKLIRRRSGNDPCPLSSAQQQIWLVDQLEHGSAFFNLIDGLRVSGRLDISALERSVDAIITRHEILRTVFFAVDGKPLQRAITPPPFKLPVIDLSRYDKKQQEHEIRSLAETEAGRRFDLSKGELLHVTLLTLDAEEWVILISTHHIAVDGISAGILLNELVEFYHAFSANLPVKLAELQAQYADYAIWQRELSPEAIFENQLAWWKRQLSGAEFDPPLPADRPRPSRQNFKGNTLWRQLPLPLSNDLKRLSRSKDVTLFMTLLAAYNVLLLHRSEKEDLIIGLPLTGRNQVELEGVIGNFAHPLVFRAQPKRNSRFSALLDQVKETMLGAFSHQDMPFERLVNELRPARSLGHHPLFQVGFTLDYRRAIPPEMPGLKVRQLELMTDTAQLDLILHLIDTDDGLAGSWQYSTALFNEETIAGMADDFERILGQIVEGPDISVKDLIIRIKTAQKDARKSNKERIAATSYGLLQTARRKVLHESDWETQVKMGYLSEEKKLPLVIEPVNKGANPFGWITAKRDLIEANLLRHGGILFRNFDIRGVEEFERFVKLLSQQMLEYRERSSPRTHVGNCIYTSTDHPPDQSIFLHNENSYQQTWPMKIFFFCQTAPVDRGETPIADVRRVYQRLSPQIRDMFVQKQWMYVRNFGYGLGLSWQTVFGADDRAKVEAHCRDRQISVEWKPDNRLKTRAVRPASARHPQTGEMLWFNHATFFHVSTLPEEISRTLIDQFAEEDLPTNTFYGDGSTISAEVLDALREAYLRETVLFPWQEGDVLLLDNMITAHGRSPYSGPRSVLVAMADPCSDRGL